MEDVRIIERGWAGHFISASRCLFRRNTLIEYKGKKWIVSTVGSMLSHNDTKIEPIGLNHWYETMAFEGYDHDGYIEADIETEIPFESEKRIYGETYEEMLMKYKTPDNAANEMHDNIVKELSVKITL